MKTKDVMKITGLPVLFASMCCLSPIILVLLGVSTVSFASSLADTFYGEYKWYFRGFGLLTLVASLWIYFRSKGICTLDQVKRNKNKVMNTVLISFIVATLAYVFWLYVVVHYWGVWLNLWN